MNLSASHFYRLAINPLAASVALAGCAAPFGGETFEGDITYVDPYVNEMTREAIVYLKFDNAVGQREHVTFANVQMRNTLAAIAILAPKTAVIETGKHPVTFAGLGR